ncbi:MAG: hypothetical protein RR980_06785, partial [Mucinivorans sp.]
SWGRRAPNPRWGLNAILGIEMWATAKTLAVQQAQTARRATARVSPQPCYLGLRAPNPRPRVAFDCCV